MAGLTAPGLKPRTPTAAAYPAAAPRSAPGGLNAGGYGSAPPVASTTPQNPTAMNTTGGATQQTDQMGRVTTSYGGGTNMFGGPTQGAPASINIEDPYQNRLSQDFAAYQNKALFDQGLAENAASKVPGAGGGGGGGAGGGGGGLDEAAIMSILDKLGGQTPPPRENAPAPLERIESPEAVASPSAKSQGFARAKDNSGRLAGAALRNLRSEMVSRGIEGSGVEGQLTGNILGETARGVADASFEQERNAENQAWDARKIGYQGNITQRAGDQGTLTNNFNTNTTQRQQDISAQQNRLALAPTVLSMLSRARY